MYFTGCLPQTITSAPALFAGLAGQGPVITTTNTIVSHGQAAGLTTLHGQVEHHRRSGAAGAARWFGGQGYMIPRTQPRSDDRPRHVVADPGKHAPRPRSAPAHQAQFIAARVAQRV